MARIALNVDAAAFEKAGSRDFAPIPKGKYPCTIFDVKNDVVATGEYAGQPRPNIQFKIADGTVDANGNKVGNRHLFWGVNAYKTKSRQNPGEMVEAWDWLSLCKALGYSNEEISEGLDTDDFLGREIIVSVGLEEKKTKESGWKEPELEPDGKGGFQPVYKNVVKGVFSVEQAETFSANATKVHAKAATKGSLNFSL